MTEEYFKDLCLKYKNRGALIDSNLLLLYFVGQYDPSLVGVFKRLRAYSPEDLELVNGVFDFFDKVVTAPNILTEVSNLSGHLTSDHRYPYYKGFKESLKLLAEKYIPSHEALQLPHVSIYGLTDMVIEHLSKEQFLVFTDDLDLHTFLTSRGIDCININHLRSLRWKW